MKSSQKKKILCDLELHTDHLIPDRKYLKKKKKKKSLPNSLLCRSGEPLSKNQRKRKEEQELRPCQRTGKVMDNERDNNTTYNWCAKYGRQRFGKRPRRARNRKTWRDHPKYNISRIGENTEKSPGGLRRLAVVQIPAKDYQPTLVWKTRLC